MNELVKLANRYKNVITLMEELEKRKEKAEDIINSFTSDMAELRKEALEIDEVRMSILFKKVVDTELYDEITVGDFKAYQKEQARKLIHYTPDKLRKLIAVYNEAKDLDKELFMFEGNEYSTAHAQHIINSLEIFMKK